LNLDEVAIAHKIVGHFHRSSIDAAALRKKTSIGKPPNQTINTSSCNPMEFLNHLELQQMLFHPKQQLQSHLFCK